MTAPAKKGTSWGDEYVIGHYQKSVILPNLLRLVNPQKNEVVLDLGCGPGFFSGEIAKRGTKVLGIDLSKTLIEQAKKNHPGINFRAADAERMEFFADHSIDKIFSVLAIQNMDSLHKVFSECARLLKPSGKLFLILNHPAFRVPKRSAWGWDDGKKMQYRRVDGYLSESKEKISMHPGDKPSEYTVSFHRPLQVYFKNLRNNGFAVTTLEEWESNKASEPGPRAKAENLARKEIPLFLLIEATKI
ncbi:MAG: methyltransferase domain-containing protein [Patescibacteria group bacterium]